VINRELGLTHEAGYRVEDLYTKKDYGILSPDDKITVDVNPSGCVMLRFTVASAFQKQLVPFGLSSNLNQNQDKRGLPQRLQWLSRFPLSRSLEVNEEE